MLGQVVGNYRIVAKLAAGGMGVVYRAEHEMIGRSVAIKVLLPEFSHKREIVDRFFNEARAASSIRHPGIIEIFDFGYHADGHAYIVMEFLEGETLTSRLQRRGRLSASEAVAIIRGVSGAVAAAHAKGVVHRDLKPDNIFLVPDPDMPGGERTKVLDFGIAKLSDLAGGDGGPSLRTRTGAVMGTPTYMAPEQCRGAGSVDHRADIYALGVILYELVCGRAPFVAEGFGEIIAAHLTAPVPAPRTFAPDLPAHLEAVLMRLLAKRPDERPGSLDEVRAALEESALHSQAYATGPGHQWPRAASGAGVSTVVAPNTPTTLGGAAAEATSSQTHYSKGRGVLYAGIAASVVGLAALAVVLSSGPDANSKPTAPAKVTSAVAPPVAAPPASDPPAPQPPASHPLEQPPPATPTPSPTVRIALEIEPKDARVEVDGAVVGSNPIELERSTGTHRIVVSADGYRSNTLEVASDADSEHEIVLKKNRRPKPPKSTTPKPRERKLGPVEVDL